MTTLVGAPSVSQFSPLLWAAAATGAVVGLGVVLVLAELAPGQPRLRDALDRLAPQRQAVVAPSTAPPGLQERVGTEVLRRFGGTLVSGARRRDLALLGISPTHHLGEKVLLGFVGLVFPPTLALATSLVGLSQPWQLPAFAALVFAVLFYLLPELTVRARAGQARAAFARAIGAYVELVALERLSGAGTTQALERAATISDFWPFQRIREELLRSRLSGVTPWQALGELAGELGVPELAEMADVMRLAGEQGAHIYEALRARGRSLRIKLLTDEKSRANAASESLAVPVAALAVVFVALLAAPAALQIL